MIDVGRSGDERDDDFAYNTTLKLNKTVHLTFRRVLHEKDTIGNTRNHGGPAQKPKDSESDSKEEIVGGLEKQVESM